MIDLTDPAALRAEAERRAKLREQGASSFGDPTPPAPTLTPEQLAQQQRDANAREKEEQWEVTKRFRVCGFKVRSTSQARASKIAPGIPDLIIHHRDAPIFLFWESKRQVGGKYSDAQLEFREDCERAAITCIGGDRYDAERYLVSIGRAWITAGGVFEPYHPPGA